jgi:uncharacterized SAM-binding protein YcdF (DUF218 family)
LARVYRPVRWVWMSTQHATAIVALGCKVEPDGSPSPPFSRRIAWAAAAFEAGLGHVVIASGGRRWSGHAEASTAARRLVELGVPGDRVYPELSSMTTVENALFSVELADALGFKSLVVVTCTFHLTRALSCFRAVGACVSGLGAPTAPSPLGRRLERLVHERCARTLDLRYLAAVRRVRADGADGGALGT